VWIVAALAVLSVGGVVVPIDDLADAEQLKAALASSAAQVIFTTARHLESSGEILRTHARRLILVDEDKGNGRLATGWRSLLGERMQDLAAPAPESLSDGIRRRYAFGPAISNRERNSRYSPLLTSTREGRISPAFRVDHAASRK
jgi:acyl-CoA synthetase (AMP-forming)/AMP-acid ligase II